MKKVLITTTFSALVALSIGYYLGMAEKESSEKLIYCSIYMVYSDGLVYSLNAEDVDAASETKERLLSELRMVNGKLQRCIELELPTIEKMETSYGKATKLLQGS